MYSPHPPLTPFFGITHISTNQQHLYTRHTRLHTALHSRPPFALFSHSQWTIPSSESAEDGSGLVGGKRIKNTQPCILGSILTFRRHWHLTLSPPLPPPRKNKKTKTNNRRRVIFHWFKREDARWAPACLTGFWSVGAERAGGGGGRRGRIHLDV